MKQYYVRMMSQFYEGHSIMKGQYYERTQLANL